MQNKAYSKKFTINIDVFNAELTVWVTDDETKIERFLRNKGFSKKMSKIEADDGGSYLYLPEEGRHILWVRCIPTDSTELGFLAHEIHHAAKGILRTRNVKDEESGAYLTGFLTEKISQKLKVFPS